MQEKRQKLKSFNKRFVEYCNSLDETARKEFYKRIAKECAVTQWVIYFWRSGRTPIKLLYRDKINEIAGKNIFGEEASCE